MLRREVKQVLSPRAKHWVGDGFYVSTMFSPFHVDPQLTSPFVLLDHAAPKHFDPTDQRRGVGEHPLGKIGERLVGNEKPDLDDGSYEVGFEGAFEQ